jgi:hypothetical protein
VKTLVNNPFLPKRSKFTRALLAQQIFFEGLNIRKEQVKIKNRMINPFQLCFLQSAQATVLGLRLR